MQGKLYTHDSPRYAFDDFKKLQRKNSERYLKYQPRN